MWNKQKLWERRIQILIFPLWILNLGFLVESFIGINAIWIYSISFTTLTMTMVPYQTLYEKVRDWLKRDSPRKSEDRNLNILTYWDEPRDIAEEVQGSLSFLSRPYRYPQNVIETSTGTVRTLPHPSKNHWSNKRGNDSN